MHVVSTFTAAQRAGLAVLAEDLRRHEPSTAFTALALDGAPSTIPHSDDLDVAAALGPGPTFAELRWALEEDHLRAVSRPILMAQALRSGADLVVHLAPTVGLLAPLREMEALHGSGLRALLRSPAPLPEDARHPDAIDVLRAGLACEAVVPAGTEAIPALDRWARAALARWIADEPARSADLLALVATSEPGAELVDEPRHLDAWRLVGGRSVEGAVTIDFAGRSALAPHRTTAEVPPPHRRLLIDDEQLARAHLERDERERSIEVQPASPPHLRPDVAYDDTMRSLYAEALRAWLRDDGPRPPSPEDPEQFLAWCGAPRHGGPVPVSRYVAAVRSGRPDLIDAFGEVPGRDAPALVQWARTHGLEEGDIPAALVPAPPEPQEERGYQQPGVNLAGFLDAELGVGEVARRLAEAMDAASVPYGTFTFTRTSSRRSANPPPEREPRYDTNIVCVNADSLGEFVQTVGPAFSAGRHRIGVWFWETSDLPAFFHPALGNVDELWAASDFVADALRAAAPPTMPVVRFPLPIVVPRIDPATTRAALDLPDERFIFVCSLDFLSIAERKNPFGVVEAFREAFAADEGPLLLVKSINADRNPDEWQRLRWAARDRRDIVLRDGYLDSPTNASLLALADCVVSLHRSEGFGFNLADAMALGTPVLATEYSGNLSFMRAEEGNLVPAGRTEVGPGRFPYDPRSVWADPDLTVAAQMMRDVVTDPVAARARAQVARDRVLREFTPRATGEFIRDRLAAVRTVPTPGSTPNAVRKVASRLLRTRRI